ncbi:phospholipase A2 [Fusarium oxysporum f. sp. conglutinans race 2 54008]|uniref:Lysophospholipase n=1 Tax=Fusarium oxysporum f. sp. conglutinans race 2 54008 TaxID=1089457 RepID=X0GUP1_FUSOX|nr:phospholipase A2 [Fusarium oxysporum f. sp. conglutinans race 2 54008]
MISCGRLIQLAILLALSTATHCGFPEGGLFPILEPRATPDAPDGYTPARVPCPKTRPAIRQAKTLSTEETSWLELRDNSTFPALEEFLTRANLGGIDIETYLNGIVTNGTRLPRIGIAISGGGYRAMINGAGAIAAFDNRTTGSTSKGQLGGILQATTYLSGPLIVYLPNAPYSYESNFTTFDLEYSDSERNQILRNGYNVATMGNGTVDSEWPACTVSRDTVGTARRTRQFQTPTSQN